MSAMEQRQVTFGPFRLDRANRSLHRGPSVIPLRPKAFAVLERLVAHAGRLVTKDELLAAVWPDTAVSDTVLKVCVREIRDALGDSPDTPRFVETAHRLGYRFVGQISHTHLPASLSTLVGRQCEIADIFHMLEHSRLVTLVGAGGSGKSRLAQEVARSIDHTFEEGARWIDLAPLSDAAFVPQAVATVLGVREQPGQGLPDTLRRYLAPRQILLVVDNCEHVIGAAAGLLASLLQAAPRLRILATSREPMRTDGEGLFPVPPLSVPCTQEVLPPDRVLEYESVRLFAERARAALPSFVLSTANCKAVTEICRHLDGLPLAIELAAPRVRALAVEQIAARLDDCLRVLGSGLRTELPRHQTLRAAIDWSYDLLTAHERRLLCRLSVFVDSFTLEAAGDVAAGMGVDRAGVVDILSQLIDKSLVHIVDADGAMLRYRLLETVRQYAHQKLLAADDASPALTQHADHYLRLVEGIEPRLNTSARPHWLAVLDREHANLRMALERTSHGAAPDLLCRLASALFWFWFHRGHWREGRTFLSAAIGRDQAPTPSRARALLGDGVLAWAEGDLGAAGPRLEEAVELGRTIADLPAAAHALHFLAMVRLGEGDALAGRSLGEQAVALARGTADAFCLTLALASSGVVLLALERYDEARLALEESVARGREAGDAWAVALPLRNLAIIALRRRDYDTARALLEESLRGLRAVGEKWFLSRSMETLAEVMAAAGDSERAARLFGAAETLRDAVGASVLAFYRTDYERAIGLARTALGQPRFESCWTAGRALSPDDAVAYALAESTGVPR